MTISGWCGGPDGAHDGFHDVCQQRIDAGHIKSCACPNHLSLTGVSSIATGILEGTETAPGRCANTVQPRGLADDWSID